MGSKGIKRRKKKYKHIIFYSFRSFSFMKPVATFETQIMSAINIFAVNERCKERHRINAKRTKRERRTNTNMPSS